MIDNTVLITGGTGFLGQALVRALLAAEVKHVIVFSHSEEAQRAMRVALPHWRLHFWLGDVRDVRALDRAVVTHQVDRIIHAAAIKAVPTCELFPLEAVQTNVVGTANVIDVADRHALFRVVALSSDKAVAPTGVYGATKALVERMMVAAGLTAIRCGNIIGSTGSVMPIWRKQVAEGDPITVTDRSMTRFYASVDEVVTFVLRVLMEMDGGEIYVPKLHACPLGMLADAVSLNQHVIGTRPGERLHEVLLLPDESVVDVGWAYVVKPNAPRFGQTYSSETVMTLDPLRVIEAA